MTGSRGAAAAAAAAEAVAMSGQQGAPPVEVTRKVTGQKMPTPRSLSLFTHPSAGWRRLRMTLVGGT